MEASSNPILGLTVPCRWLPDLSYPRWKKWYSTTTYHSGSTEALVPYDIPTGQNCVNLPVARRVLNTRNSIVLSRSVANSIDLTTPAYMLSGTNTTSTGADTLIGLDYDSLPLEMANDVIAFGLDTALSINDVVLACRVLAIKHTFHFINYNKHPVKIYYSIAPGGWTIEDISSPTTPMPDLINSQYRSIVVPGVEDEGDRGVSRELTISLSLSKLFPDQYDAPPQVRNADISTAATDSPWFNLGEIGGVPMPFSEPPGYVTVAGTGTNSVAMPFQPASLSLRLAAQGLTGVQAGSTSYTPATDGQINTNGLVIKANHNWLIEYYRNTRISSGHPNPEAYPSQV